MSSSKSAINLGLERIRALLGHLPPYTRPTCHIAGTNGKGSVTALLSSILTASSYRVGRFNSPHLVSILDSITIDDSPVLKYTYSDMRQRVETVDRDHNIGASSFELLTATALMIFEDAAVDIAVVEVGMGGRLDATNVISDEQILVSALTAVDLDHQLFLGDTVEKIAIEKAAIARKGRPFVLGFQPHPEVNQVVREVVAKVGGTVIEALVPTKRKRDPKLDGEEPLINRIPPFSVPIDLLLPLKGDHQLQNLGIALTIVSALLVQPDTSLQLHKNITPETIANGVRNTHWPGRLSFHRISLPLPLAHPVSPQEVINTATVTSRFLVLADGAHNPASSTTLASFINNVLGGRISTPSAATNPITLSYVIALSHSPPKKPKDTLSPLFAVAASLLSTTQESHLYQIRVRVAFLRFTSPDGMPWVRPEPPSKLKGLVSPLLSEAEIWTAADSGSEPKEDLKEALNWVTRDQHLKDSEGLIVVAGSLYLVADFYRLLQSQKSVD
ncbi:Mur ligase [Irpex rosettiformis]|uniref:Mur ligase n=1 Tax=Irpex rosettiformis TaxID=378272 RepID=A0ACB8TRZ3_9APHY|nr:Mur ligase [Irpex rosettiformis]